MTEANVEHLANLIHSLRTRKKVTVRQLAAKINRSIGFISQLERGLSKPTVEDLSAISQALEVSSNYFVTQSVSPHQQWITKKNERRTLGYANGVTDQVISPTFSKKFIMLETILEPGSEFDERNVIDSFEQGGYVLEGELSISINEEEIQIGVGDGFQITSDMQCRYSNKSKNATRVLWVYS
jgi:transcriptional regulator with XRE-family HTH domain